MAKTKLKTIPEGTNYLDLWENNYRPRILEHHQVPIDLVAEVLGISVSKVQEQLKSGLYEYGVARPCSGGSYRYEFTPLRLIAYVEGRLSKPIYINHGEAS